MKKRKFVPDYTAGKQTACDMCEGRGWTWRYIGRNGEQFMTTSQEWSGYMDRQYKEWLKTAKKKKVSCGTCDGTGVMPEHLKPGYWQARIDRDKELRKPWVFWPAVLGHIARLFESL